MSVHSPGASDAPAGGGSLITIERVVVVLTPVFGALSAWLTAWVSTHFPGLPPINRDDLTALEVSGFLGAVAAALKWLHGRQIMLGRAQVAGHPAAPVQAPVAAAPEAAAGS